MIAEYLLANNTVMLTEFHACRSKLEQDGMNAMAEVFLKQRSLQVIDVSQCGSKWGLRKLFEALKECKELRHVNVNDNHINKAIPQLKSFLESVNSNLEYLNISNLNMKKKNCKIISEVLIESIKNSRIKDLSWDYDLNCSTSTAQEFLTNFAEIENCPVERLSMIGVFNDRKNRNEVRSLFKQCQTNITLFKPDYTDEESEERDASEEESQEEGSSSASEKQEYSDND